MSVMLANRYMQAHRFADALPHYEAELREHPEDHAAALKLIVCYVQTGRIQEAVDHMTMLVESVPEALLGLDPEAAGIPTGYVTAAVERRQGLLPPGQQYAALAVLHLYSDPHVALDDIVVARRSRSTVSGLAHLETAVRCCLEDTT